MAMKHSPLETEIEIAAGWWANQIRSKHPDAPNIDAFERCLRDELRARYRDHWYPHDIPRGSGFRAISFDLRMDPALAAAGAAAKIEDLEKLLTHVRDQVMFVNPGEVKIRNAALLTTSSRIIYSINPPEDESPSHTGSNSGPSGAGAGSSGAAGSGSTVSASAPSFTPSGYLSSSSAYAGPTFIPSSGVGVARPAYTMSSASASSPVVNGGGLGGGPGLSTGGDDGYDGNDYVRARSLAMHPNSGGAGAGMSAGAGGGSDLRPNAGHWVPSGPMTPGAGNGLGGMGGMGGGGMTGGYQTGGNLGVNAATAGGAGQTILAGNRVGAIAAGGGVGAAAANRSRGYSSSANTGYGMNTGSAPPGRR